jgi:energy-converting hydrogenase Eha subunit C
MTLLYFVLLASAIAATSRAKSPLQAVWGLTEILLILSGIVCVVSAMFLLARPPWRGQLVWFGLLSVGVCGVSVAMRSLDVAIASLVVGLMMLVAVLRNWKVPTIFGHHDMLPAVGNEVSQQPVHDLFLTAGTGFLTAILLIGTFYYVTRAEMHRTTASRRHTAIPSRERVSSINPPNAEERVDDLAFGHRSDVVILLTVLAFITVASAMPVARKQA